MKSIIFYALFLTVVAVSSGYGQSEDLDYKLLATSRTSTMQKEIDEAAAVGYRIVVGAPTGGSELIFFLAKEGSREQPFRYKLLATNRTGTMQKEMNETADFGFRLVPSSVTSKGGEIVMVFEKEPGPDRDRYDYKLLATNRTGTLQREATQAKNEGYKIVAMVNRGENIVIMERHAPRDR